MFQQLVQHCAHLVKKAHQLLLYNKIQKISWLD